MKIGIFTSDFPYKEPFIDDSVKGGQWGGVGEVVYQWALGLNALGHEIKIFSVSSDGKDKYYKYQNVEVFRYGRSFQIGETGIPLGLLWKPIQHDVDMVNAHRGVPLGALSAYIYTIFKKKPLILSVHGPYLPNESYQGYSVLKKITMLLFKKIFYKRILTKARVITALSDQCVDEDEYLPRFRSKIEIIPNGLHIEEYNVEYSKEECRKLLDLPLNEPIILYLSSLVSRKGPQILIESAPNILKCHPNAKFIFIGDGMIKNELAELADTLGAKDHVNFMGFVDDIKKRNFYKSADVFCLPSFVEGYPMVLLEAAAYGLPSVVSDITPHRAIIRDKENGLIFKTGNPEDLSNKINLLLLDEELRSRLGQNALIIVQDQTWDNVIKKVNTIFHV